MSRKEQPAMVKSVAEMIGEARAQIELVSPDAVSNELEAGGAIIIDVREPVEWERHIRGALQVPRGLLEFVADPASPRHNPELNPNRRVIVYCASGARAALATLALKNMGFRNVANMDGGLKAWVAADLPTVEHHADI
jgi:rhodanese-related sulfurtransferase